MLRTCGKEDRWSLCREDTPLLEHSGEAPFATAIRREKTYSANRGTVKEHITEVERLPLTGVSEAEGTVTFFRGDHCLRMTVSPCDGAAAAADRAVEALAAALKAAWTGPMRRPWKKAPTTAHWNTRPPGCWRRNDF